MRGQTTLDFAIGVSIFLAVMLFVFSFAPGILQPFTVSGQSDTVTVDRVANRLGQQVFANASAPYAFDRHCTVAFFDRSGPDAVHSAPARCPYDDGTLNEQLGLLDRANVNVTILGNASASPAGSHPLFWDDSDQQLREVPAATPQSGDTVLSAGSSIPTRNQATVTATRVGLLAGEDVTIRVVMWS